MANPFSSLLKNSKKMGDELGVVTPHTPFPIREAFRTLYTDVLYFQKTICQLS